MEEKNTSSAPPVTSNEALESFHFAARTETSGENNEPPAAAMVVAPTSPATAPVAGGEMKKKRGRPRKYGPDGKRSLALSPTPISSSIPLTGEYPNWNRQIELPRERIKKSQRFEYENPGQRIAYSVGANFTPHIITVNAGEDVMMKVMSFSQQESRAICILSANGMISNVTLRQATSSGGTLTYEGRFEILALTGSYMPTLNGDTKSTCGGTSISLAGQDGRVMGGGLAGLLVAAGPVQVVVGSFIPGHQLEQKPKKPRIESTTIFFPSINTITAEEMKRMYGAVNPALTTAPYQEHNPVSPSPVIGFKISSTENLALPEQELNTQDQSNCKASC